MYLYTNMMEFAPFGSAENRRSRSAEIVTPSHDNVPRPSPKSIYRLTDKVRMRSFQFSRRLTDPHHSTMSRYSKPLL